jgi:hypothetical protein
VQPACGYTTIQQDCHEAQSQKIGKPNKLKIIGSKKTKGLKQNNQNRLHSPMPEGGEL